MTNEITYEEEQYQHGTPADWQKAADDLEAELEKTNPGDRAEAIRNVYKHFVHDGVLEFDALHYDLWDRGLDEDLLTKYYEEFVQVLTHKELSK